MMDILEALQIENLLEYMNNINKARQTPIEITIDEDNDDFKNFEVKLEKYPEEETTLHPKRMKRSQEALDNPKEGSDPKSKSSEQQIEDTSDEIGEGPRGKMSFVALERMNLESFTEGRKSESALPTLTPKLESSAQPTLPRQESTPKLRHFRCQFCRKSMPDKGSLNFHVKKCKSRPSNNQDISMSLSPLSPILKSSGETAIRPGDELNLPRNKEEITRKFIWDEILEPKLELNGNKFANDLLEIKKESLSSDDEFSPMANPPTFSSANDSHSAVFTASKNDQTLPAAKESSEGPNFNMTAPAQLENLTFGQAPERSEQQRRPKAMSETESDSNQSKEIPPQEESTVKMETDNAPRRKSRKLHCPVCFKTQGSAKLMNTHLMNFHFKYCDKESGERGWECLKCSKIVPPKSKLLSHAISCDVRQFRQPDLEGKEAATQIKSVCVNCAGNLTNKRKRKCGECGPCKIQKCKSCKFCQRPSLKRPCERKICLNPIYPKCACPLN